MNDIVIGDAAPESRVQLLTDLPPMDLPHGAVLNDDGSVTLALEFPAKIVLRAMGAATSNEEVVAQLTLRRLTGANVRKMIGSKNFQTVALAASSGLGLGKLNLLQNVMDARDETAADNVVAELLGGLVSGVPDYATETPEGVTLPLIFAATDEEGGVVTELKIKRLTAAQRRQAADAKNLLDWGVAMATGLTPRLAKSLVDSMDGADAMAVNQVILFLCGNGRRTGR